MFWYLLAGLVVGAAVGGRVGWVQGVDEGAEKLLAETAKVNKILNALGALSRMGYSFRHIAYTHTMKADSAEKEVVFRTTAEMFAETLVYADSVAEEIRRQAQRG